MSHKGHVVNTVPSAAVYTSPSGHHTTVVMQQQPYVVTRSSPGLFGSLGRELNNLGRTISREIDWTADQINKSLATTATGNILNLFQSGNFVQLVSRISGRSLEIVQGPAGLVVDGLGPDNAPHATWTIVNEGGNQVRLHNNNNFLAIINGSTIVIHMPPGVMHGVETKFQVTQHGQFIILESLKERGRHVGVLPGGALKPALATGKEDHAMFGVRLMYSPYSVVTK
ncbi:uncharacterized protein LOC127860719 [Dreissena polymorpha]|uniref:Uncharacterized protein n=1 Tax=Dreissena polymorpha TaxID=45954 RepID=A0A9D3YMB4_DREPO|nr:uncharacterized protein LOC127860719 [Dreissena polymorpha]KAH3701845.1 hypothetical protein DPMN_076841 [Dreissena polymorpha]